MIHLKMNLLIHSDFEEQKHELSIYHTHTSLSGTLDQSGINIIIFSVFNCYQQK